MPLLLNRIISNLYKKYYRTFKNKKQLNQLSRVDDDSLKAVSTALENVLNNKISAEELKWVNKIKEIRDHLRQSSEEIKFEDFGAGSHIDSISVEKTNNKEVITKTLRKICEATVLYRWGTLLFKLVRTFKPLMCLELGTCVGISSSYQAAALELNNKGKLITIEGAPSLAEIAKKTSKKLNLERISGKVGLFRDVLPDLLPQIKPIDFAFIDGHHDGQATVNYFKQIYPFLSESAILLFDDISWSKDMRNAWKTFERDNNIKFTIDLWSMGICVISKGQEKKKNFKILFE